MLIAFSFSGIVLASCGDDNSREGVDARVNDANAEPDAADSSIDASEDSGADGGEVDLCPDELYGYPCLAANNQQCRVNGSLECYGIYLQNVCGPPGRSCSGQDTSCSANDQVCHYPLIPGDEQERGVCLTESERRCFCSNIGVNQRPSFCPIYDYERPGLDSSCECDGYCVSETGKGPCQPDLVCAQYVCRTPCETTDDCLDGYRCITFADRDRNPLGKACFK